MSTPYTPKISCISMPNIYACKYESLRMFLYPVHKIKSIVFCKNKNKVSKIVFRENIKKELIEITGSYFSKNRQAGSGFINKIQITDIEIISMLSEIKYVLFYANFIVGVDKYNLFLNAFICSELNKSINIWTETDYRLTLICQSVVADCLLDNITIDKLKKM